jgi:hypothetical protein
MINFRFHIASLVAVFLALALGIVIGSTVIDRAIVDSLNERLDDIEQEAADTRNRNNELNSDIGRLEEYIENSQDFAVADVLDGVPVVTLAVRGIDENPVSDTVELAQKAGADALGILWLEEKLKLEDESTVDELAAILGREGASRRAVRTATWEALASRLGGAPGLSGDPPDLLSRLSDAGFVQFQPVGDPPNGFTIDDLPSGGDRALLADGTGSTLSAEGTVVPLARTLQSAGVPLVVGEVYQERDDGPDRGATVVPIRSDDELSATVSTVDDLDMREGRVAAVIGLSQLATGVYGHYGYGTDATAPFPAPATP